MSLLAVFLFALVVSLPSLPMPAYGQDAASSPPAAAHIKINRIGQRDFVLDLAGLLSPEQTTQVKKIAADLLDQEKVPLIVVTMENRADYSDRPLPLEDFAMTLYDQWGIGHLSINGVDYNKGILLIVARGNREARVELGRGYGRRMDADSQLVMDNSVIPHFKNDDYGHGIVAGATGLAFMVRGQAQPAGQRNAATGKRKSTGLAAQFDDVSELQWVVYFTILTIALMTGISLFRHGRKGLGWVFWREVLELVFSIIKALLTSRRGCNGSCFGGGSFSSWSSSSSDSFFSGGSSFGGGGGSSSGGGGSFGGGSSGGGGASGRW